MHIVHECLPSPTTSDSVRRSDQKPVERTNEIKGDAISFGPLHWFPVATDQTVGPSPKVDRVLTLRCKPLNAEPLHMPQFLSLSLLFSYYCLCILFRYNLFVCLQVYKIVTNYSAKPHCFGLHGSL